MELTYNYNMEQNMDRIQESWLSLRTQVDASVIEDVDIKTGKVTNDHLDACSGCPVCEGDLNR